MLLNGAHDYRDYAAVSVNATPPPEGMAWPLMPGQITLDDVLSALPWRVAILDYDGAIVGVNDAWQRLSISDGAPPSPERVIGLSYFDVGRRGSGLSDEGARQVYKGTREVLAGRRACFSWEYSYHVLGEQRWSQLTVTPLANGRPDALVQQFDITARKLAEGGRDKALREREEAAESERASREATRQMELFMALAGHEIRTPLTLIKGHLHLAKLALGPTTRQGKPATWQAPVSAQESLDVAQRAANRLANVLEELLEVTNAKAGRLVLHPERCDLVALVREQVAEQRLLHPARRLRLHLERRRSVVTQADPVRLTEVLTNFLNNACKYSPESMPIDVMLHVGDGEARIAARDRGPGLSRDAQARVWECFYKVPGIKSQLDGESGLGLGLYLTRMIVEQHGGKVGVESTEGKGATFWCALPLVPHEA